MIDDSSLIITEQEPDEYDILAQELDVVGTSTIDEYETFTSQVSISINCSPLTWWLRDEQQGHYPNLSKMAVDILSIPAMSHPQFGRLDNLLDLSTKRANNCLSLLVPCQISFAGDSLNSLTGVSQSME